MKAKLLILTIMTMFSTTGFAHHPAADIVDEETYAMIDELVSDTPHATLDFSDMGSSMDIVLPSDDQEAIDTLTSDLQAIVDDSATEYEISVDQTGNMTTISLNAV